MINAVCFLGTAEVEEEAVSPILRVFLSGAATDARANIPTRGNNFRNSITCATQSRGRPATTTPRGYAVMSGSTLRAGTRARGGESK